MIFAGTGWSSQVNAAIFSSIGLIVVALATFFGVRWQTRRQLAHDETERYLGRVHERDQLLAPSRLEAASRFSDIAEKIGDRIRHLEDDPPGDLESYGPAQDEWRNRQAALMTDLEVAYRRVPDAYGSGSEVSEAAIRVLIAAFECGAPIARYLGALDQRTYVRDAGHEGELRSRARDEADEARVAMQKSRVALNGLRGDFMETAQRAAMMVARVKP